MKRTLITTACAIFIFGTACAREVTLSPTFILHGATVVTGRRAAQINTVVGCTTRYIPTHDERGWYARKSVDCVE